VGASLEGELKRRGVDRGDVNHWVDPGKREERVLKK